MDRDRKRELLSHLVRSGRIDQALVFTRTKHGANRLAEQLGRDGIAAAAIHGNKSQPQRVRALDDFKAGRVAILVATDIAARGLDIDALPHVVNYELPMVPRTTSTASAGPVAPAWTARRSRSSAWTRRGSCATSRPSWATGLPSKLVEGFEPDRSIRSEPIRLRTGGGRPVARPAGRRSAAPARPGRSPQVPRSAPSGRSTYQHQPAPAHVRPARHEPVLAGAGSSRSFVTLPGERLARFSDR